MKIKKSTLKGVIKEAIMQEIVNLRNEQREIARYAVGCVETLPFLSEHKNIKSKEALVEFFGPFKKLGVSDLEKMSDKKAASQKQKDVSQLKSHVAKQVSEVERARKVLASTSLTDVGSVEAKLNDYVTKLAALHDVIGMSTDEKEMAQASKPFAIAAFTLQKLSDALSNASEKLFTAIPHNDRVYDMGKEADEVDTASKKFLLKPGGSLRQMAQNALSGLGGTSAGRFSTPSR